MTGKEVRKNHIFFFFTAFSCSGLFLVIRIAVPDWLRVSNVGEGGGNVYLGILPPVYWREQTIVNNTEVGGRDPEEYRMSKIISRCVHRIVNGTWLAGEGCHNRNC